MQCNIKKLPCLNLIEAFIKFQDNQQTSWSNHLLWAYPGYRSIFFKHGKKNYAEYKCRTIKEEVDKKSQKTGAQNSYIF